MKILKEHTCSKCSHVFKWQYQIPQKLGSLLQAEIIDNDVVKLQEGINFKQMNGFKIPTNPYLWCPNCDSKNNIEISLDDLNRN